MRPWLSLAVGIAALGGAVGLAVAAPPHRSSVPCETDADCEALEGHGVCFLSTQGGRCVAGLPPAPASLALEFALLGRSAAAADLTWVRTLQFVGAPWAERVEYAGLADWLERVTTLDPSFGHAYMIGGVLLATIPGRSDDADQLLKRAESHLTDQRQLSQVAQWRGFVAYYGAFDPARAAEHYQRAYDLGGPPVLRDRARTLRTQAANCSEVWKSLSEWGANPDLVGADLIDDKRRVKIMQNCFQEQLNAALSSWRVGGHGDPAHINELVDAGLMPGIPPTLEAGKCWTPIQGKAYLRPCEAQK